MTLVSAGSIFILFLGFLWSVLDLNGFLLLFLVAAGWNIKPSWFPVSVFIFSCIIVSFSVFPVQFHFKISVLLSSFKF